jgi:hypothetical protein
MHWIDPDCLPTIAGKVDCFVLNPHGEIDGFVLADPTQAATLVHTPPHLAEELTRHVKTGDHVSVRGVRPRGAELLAAVAVTAESGERIIDNGPEKQRERAKVHPEKTEVEGTVRLSLFGPEGELRGALLTDGTIIRVGPKEAKAIARFLSPGASVAASGDGVRTRHGRVVDARKIGGDSASLLPVRGEKGKHHKHDKART